MQDTEWTRHQNERDAENSPSVPVEARSLQRADEDASLNEIPTFFAPSFGAGTSPWYRPEDFAASDHQHLNEDPPSHALYPLHQTGGTYSGHMDTMRNVAYDADLVTATAMIEPAVTRDGFRCLSDSLHSPSGFDAAFDNCHPSHQLFHANSAAGQAETWTPDNQLGHWAHMDHDGPPLCPFDRSPSNLPPFIQPGSTLQCIPNLNVWDGRMAEERYMSMDVPAITPPEIPSTDGPEHIAPLHERSDRPWGFLNGGLYDPGAEIFDDEAATLNGVKGIPTARWSDAVTAFDVSQPHAEMTDAYMPSIYENLTAISTQESAIRPDSNSRSFHGDLQEPDLLHVVETGTLRAASDDTQIRNHSAGRRRHDEEAQTVQPSISQNSRPKQGRRRPRPVTAASRETLTSPEQASSAPPGRNRTRGQGIKAKLSSEGKIPIRLPKAGDVSSSVLSPSRFLGESAQFHEITADDWSKSANDYCNKETILGQELGDSSDKILSVFVLRRYAARPRRSGDKKYGGPVYQLAQPNAQKTLTSGEDFSWARTQEELRNKLRTRADALGIDLGSDEDITGKWNPIRKAYGKAFKESHKSNGSVNCRAHDAYVVATWSSEKGLLFKGMPVDEECSARSLPADTTRLGG